MPLPKKLTYTIKDIYDLPEGQCAELVDGQMYMMAPPSKIHQKLVQELSRFFGNYIAEKGSSCEVYPAQFAVFLIADDKNYVEPDISIICDKKSSSGAPDFIIEVVFPQQPTHGLFHQIV